MARLTLVALLVLQCGISVANVGQDDAQDAVRQKLEASKAEFESDIKKAREAAQQWFEKAEAAARNEGKKDLVDQLAVDRKALNDKTQLPNSMPSDVRSKFSRARNELVEAYGKAIKASLRGKRDADAKAFEADLERFRANIPDPNLPAGGMRWLRIVNRGTGRQLVVGGGAKSSGALVSNGALYKGDGESQSWRFHASETGWYKVENSNSKMLLTWKQPYLAVIRNAAAPDNEVGLEIQDWQIVPVGDTLDLFLIRNRASGMVLTADYIEINPPGAAVATAKATGKGNRFQQWRLYPDD